VAPLGRFRLLAAAAAVARAATAHGRRRRPHVERGRTLVAVAVYADLVRYRELFANLFRRDFQAKYRGSALGVLWSLLNPLALLGVYLVVFGLLWNGNDIAHYPLYLLAGLACWIFFSVSLQAAARSMIDSAELIKKVRFPRQLVALSIVATQAVTFAVMLVILIVLSLVFIPEARSTVWLSVPLAVLFAGFVMGFSLLVACLNVLFRDVEHILAAALLPWFFLTPVLWRFSELPERVQQHEVLLDVLRWGNFVTPPIYAVRDSLWLGHAPRPADVVYLAVVCVVSLALGAAVFSRVDDRIAVEL
jgi:homopolymeric O-antigen transport system permease protein